MGSRRTHEEAAVAAARAAYVAGFASHQQPRGRARVRRADRRHGRARVHAAARRRARGVRGPGGQPRPGHDPAGRHLRRAPRRSRSRSTSPGPSWAPCGSTPATCSPRPRGPRAAGRPGRHRDPDHRHVSDLDEYAIAALAAAPVDALRRRHVAGDRLRRADRRAGLQAGRPRGGRQRRPASDVAKKSKDKVSVGGRKWALRRRGAATASAQAEVIGIGAHAGGRRRRPAAAASSSCATARSSAASRLRPPASGTSWRGRAAADAARPALPRRAGHPDDLRGSMPAADPVRAPHRRTAASGHDREPHPGADHGRRAERLLRGRVARGGRRRGRGRGHRGTSTLHAGTDYAAVVATADWHVDPGAALQPTQPDFVDSWPPHCVVGTHGAAAAPDLEPALSTCRRSSARASTPRPTAASRGPPAAGGGRVGPRRTGCATGRSSRSTSSGIATDHCVRATALDAATEGFETRVLLDLTAGVASADDGRRARRRWPRRRRRPRRAGRSSGSAGAVRRQPLVAPAIPSGRPAAPRR